MREKKLSGKTGCRSRWLGPALEKPRGSGLLESDTSDTALCHKRQRQTGFLDIVHFIYVDLATKTTFVPIPTTNFADTRGQSISCN